MTIKVLTLFPEMFAPLNTSIIGRAQDKLIVNIEIINIRDYSQDKHGKCDDTPYGGGAGMVMTAQPIFDAVQSNDPMHEFYRIYMSPKGKVIQSNMLKTLAVNHPNILILCGHYEGVDQRVLDMCIDEEMSIGDYVLTGGELPAMVLIDSLLRFVPCVLGSSQSCEDESFSDGLLEYPQYTHPAEFMGESVPQVLVSGHHANIEKWRREQALAITKKWRPDLLK